MESRTMMRRSGEFLQEMEKMKKENHYDMVFLMITDVLREGTELLFIGDQETVCQAFNVSSTGEHSVFLPGIVSRKKQIVPALSQLWG